MSGDEQMQALYQKNDRVRVSKEAVTSTPMPSYVGTIRDVIPIYGDQTIGYAIVLDDDPRATRTWFFLQNQLKALVAGRGNGAVDER